MVKVNDSEPHSIRSPLTKSLFHHSCPAGGPNYGQSGDRKIVFFFSLFFYFFFGGGGRKIVKIIY